MVWGSFLLAAAALKTPTRNGYTAQGVNLTFCLFLGFGGRARRRRAVRATAQRGQTANRGTVSLGLRVNPIHIYI